MPELSYHTNKFIIPKYEHLVANVQHYSFHNEKPVMLNPTGCIELIIQDGAFAQAGTAHNNWVNRPASFIGGLHDQSFSIKPNKPASSLISISFKANGAKFFIPEDLSLLRNQIVSLGAIYSSNQLSNIEATQEDEQMAYKLKNIETFLDSIFFSRSVSAIDVALKIIKKNNGCISISELASQVGLGNSQLRKRFLVEVGMSPKAYCRIIRVNAIQQVIRLNQAPKLTELAYQFDYFDQSHFIKDFKTVVGISPKKYLQQIVNR